MNKHGVRYKEGQVAKCNPIQKNRAEDNAARFRGTRVESTIIKVESLTCRIKDFNNSYNETILVKGVEYNE